MAEKESALDTVISKLSPKWALKRHQARAALGVLREYEGAKKAKRRAGWNPAAKSQNLEMLKDSAILRSRARDLIRNNGWAKSAHLGFASNLVGTGIIPKFKVGSKIVKDYDEQWKSWAETTLCDVTNRNTFYGIQRLAALTLHNAGEVLIRRVAYRNQARNMKIKAPQFRLQVLEPEFIDITKNDPKTGLIQGVQVDKYGAPTGYWLFSAHPSELKTEPTLFKSTDVIHLFDERRPGQVRGVTEFDATIETIKSIDDYEDAGLQSRKISALMSVFLTGIELADDGTQAYDIPTTIEPGSITNLPQGVDVKHVTPPMASEHRDYTRSLMHKVAAGMGQSYESLTHDLSDTNYSSIRAGRVDQDRFNAVMRETVFIPKFCDRVALWFLDDPYVMAKPEVTISWISPAVAMIDPEKESIAYKNMSRNGLMSHSDLLNKLGNDPDEFLEEAAEWNLKLDALGIVLDTDPRATDLQGKARNAAPSPSTVAV
jgi:lambda family phage portal protein